MNQFDQRPVRIGSTENIGCATSNHSTNLQTTNVLNDYPYTHVSLITVFFEMENFCSKLFLSLLTTLPQILVDSFKWLLKDFYRIFRFINFVSWFCTTLCNFIYMFTHIVVRSIDSWRTNKNGEENLTQKLITYYATDLVFLLNINLIKLFNWKFTKIKMFSKHNNSVSFTSYLWSSLNQMILFFNLIIRTGQLYLNSATKLKFYARMSNVLSKTVLKFDSVIQE